MSDSKPGPAINTWPEMNLPDFIETLSSELRRPLTPILSIPDMMLKDSGGHLSEDQRQLLEVLRLNGRRMLEIVEDLVTIGKIAQQHGSDQPLEFEPLDMEPMIAGVVSDFQPELEHARVAFSYVLDPELPQIEANRGALEAVLAALLSNAIRSTNPTGTVTLRAMRSSAEEISIEVADNGTGLTREMQDKLFPPVMPARNPLWYWAVSPGLYIIKSFVDLHNGDLDVRGEVETGNVIVVTLPIKQG